MNIPNGLLIAAYGRVPRPIREFLTNAELGPIAEKLAQTYKLHVDSAGVLSDLITQTLLGFVRPDELPKKLAEHLLLDQTMTAALINDINTAVFIPLQSRVREMVEREQNEQVLEKELRDSSPEEQEVVTAPIITESEKPSPLPPLALDYAPAPTTLLGSPVPAPMPVLPPEEGLASYQAPAPLKATPEAVMVAQPVMPQQHFVHAMPNSGAQQGWHPAAAVHIFVPAHGLPGQPAVSETQPPTILQPTPAPVAVVANEIVSNTSEVAPSVQVPLTKTYAADPYREPV